MLNLFAYKYVSVGNFMTNLNVESFFKDLGLSNLDLNLYLSLLKSGPSSVSIMANKLGLKRTTVYTYLNNLLNVGLVEKVKGSMYKALNPEEIESIINNKVELFSKKKDILPNIVSQIYNLANLVQLKSITEVKYYNDTSSVNWLYDKILEQNEVRTYVNATKVIEIFPQNLHRFMNAVKRGVKIWDLHHYSSFIDEQFLKLAKTYPNVNIKRFPPSVDFDPMDFLIYNGKIAIVSGLPNIQAIEISNAQYYNMSKSIYDFIWGII